MLFFLLFFHKSAAFLEQTIVGWLSCFRNISFFFFVFSSLHFLLFVTFAISFSYKKMNILHCFGNLRPVVYQGLYVHFNSLQKLNIYFPSPVKYKKSRFELYIVFPQPTFFHFLP